ncbi:MAG TPA: hypothetical protein VE133_17470 [Candidatus Sulfotelmatobacter sp.]|jgi:outer membrane protein assembly factor BamE (lipoprotein component of BamABCDE complex)|nr:hypothetical protein [Candidatus Sulfotelmatobacter sp.]
MLTCPASLIFAVALLLSFSLAGFTQTRSLYPQRDPSRMQPGCYTTSSSLDNQLRSAAAGNYSGPAMKTPFANCQSIDTLAEIARQAEALPQHHQNEYHQNEYDDYLERKHRRELEALLLEPQAHANPEAPDQSELLRNSKDRDFILRNFHTMYVDAREAKYFGSQQMKAALGQNKEFQKLNIRMVDDPRVADVVLKITYTFAWDYPFELRHQNTTYVLLSGKGDGPFSGPLGAADVARQFANAAKPWREQKKADGK